MAMSRNASSASVEFGTRVNIAAAIVLLIYFFFPLAVMAATAGSLRSLAVAASTARSEMGVTVSYCAVPDAGIACARNRPIPDCYFAPTSCDNHYGARQ